MAALTPRPLGLAWDYPTNGMSTDLSFNLYSSTNLSTPLSNWVRIASYPATNANWYSNGLWKVPVQGTNYVFTVTNTVLPGVQFFYVAASNFWTESDPSNTVGLPPVAGQTSDLTPIKSW